MRFKSSGVSSIVQRGQILFQVFAPFRPRNRHNVAALGQHPGQRQLRRCTSLLRGDFLHALHQIEVLFEVFSLEARRLPTIVVLAASPRTCGTCRTKSPFREDYRGQSRFPIPDRPPTRRLQDRASTTNTLTAMPQWDGRWTPAAASRRRPPIDRCSGFCPDAPIRPSRPPCPQSACWDRRDVDNKDR